MLFGMSSPEDILKGFIILRVVARIASREIVVQTNKRIHFSGPSTRVLNNIFGRLLLLEFLKLV